MDLGLRGRTVFVSGASRGIGLAIVEQCLDEGAKVAMTARGVDALEAARARLAKRYGADHVWAMAGDMRETIFIESAVAAAEAELGPLFGAVANVGLYPCPEGFEIEDEMWTAAYSQNLDSAYRLARTVLRGMTARGEGSIIFIGSIAGLAALGNPLSYGSSKAALAHLSKELARIAGRSGVRVNMVAPGIVKFPGGGWDERMQGPRADIWRRWIHREMPLDRFGEPSDIASLTAYLLGPISRYLTGTVIPVDGGQMR